MACTFFQNVYKVLEMHGIPAKSLDKRRMFMKEEYRIHRISFSDPLSQCAYIRTDVPFHANALLQIIHQHPILAQLFSKEYDDSDENNDDCDECRKEKREHKRTRVTKYQDLNVMSIGCGPGTDMLALLRYIFKNGDFDHKILRLVLTDDQGAWEKITSQFEQVIRQSQEQLYKSGGSRKIKFSSKFIHWKILEEDLPLPRAISSRLEITHMFIFNLFFSNIILEKNFQKYAMGAFNIKRMFDGAMRGAFFLFIDINRLDALHIRKKGLQLAGFSSRTVLKIGKGLQEFRLPREENKGDLKEYFSLVCQPKLGRDTQLDFVIYQKL